VSPAPSIDIKGSRTEGAERVHDVDEPREEQSVGRRRSPTARRSGRRSDPITWRRAPRASTPAPVDHPRQESRPSWSVPGILAGRRLVEAAEVRFRYGSGARKSAKIAMKQSSAITRPPATARRLRLSRRTPSARGSTNGSSSLRPERPPRSRRGSPQYRILGSRTRREGRRRDS